MLLLCVYNVRREQSRLLWSLRIVLERHCERGNRVLCVVFQGVVDLVASCGWGTDCVLGVQSFYSWCPVAKQRPLSFYCGNLKPERVGRGKSVCLQVVLK